MTTAVTVISRVAAQELQPPPKIEPLFNTTVYIDPKQYGPISTPGGFQIVFNVLNATITGALNATIKGGVVYPSVYENETVQPVEGRLLGTTDDGIDFFREEKGIGGSERRINRQTLSIGGDWAYLSNAYILAVPTQLDKTTLLSQAYLVS